MVIQTSQVGMASSYKRTTYEAESVTLRGWGESGSAADFMNAVPAATDGAQTDFLRGRVQTKNEEWFGLFDTTGQQRLLPEAAGETVEAWSEENLTDSTKLELFSLKSLMEVFSEHVEVKPMSTETIFQRLLEQFRTRMEDIFLGMGNSMFSRTASRDTEWVEERTFENFKAVKEATSFQSAGTVTTKDGRSIEFETSFSMTQSFVEYTNVKIDYKKVMMIDPLVINLSGNAAEVSDQKFEFDIDADGELDNISMLGELCGFLALDKNGDGKINDGNELFGTKTGDGFAELAVFDLDKNGWIDENDEIFNRLRIWKKDENGNDKLVGLGVQGIGAIYLGNVSTAHELRGQYGANGQLQKTGIYLREDGTAGTIQHLDFAAESLS